MDTIYRLYSSKTIGYFKNKDDAISLLHHLSNAKIEVFQNCIPIGIYQIINKQLYFNDTIIKLDGFLNTWFNSESNTKSDNELNLFIPINTCNNDTIKIDKTIDMDKYLENIKKLEEEANLYENNLDNLKNIIQTKQNDLKLKNNTFIKSKRLFDKEKEDWNQFKTKLEADKRVYFIIKEELEAGELTENSIPVLFQDKFPIFEYLNNNKLIDNNDILTSNDIKNYLDALPKFNNNKSEQISDTMFSSSDPLYLFKKFDSEVSTE
jgi:hypothetical protein